MLDESLLLGLTLNQTSLVAALVLLSETEQMPPARADGAAASAGPSTHVAPVHPSGQRT